MSLCEALNKPFFEVAQWPLAEIERWQIWAQYQEAERKKRERKGRKK